MNRGPEIEVQEQKFRNRGPTAEDHSLFEVWFFLQGIMFLETICMFGVTLY